MKSTHAFMKSRRFAAALSGLMMAALMISTGAHALALTGVQSRKTHGAAGLQDIEIARGASVSGAVTVEPRAIGNGHVIVFQFDQAVTLGPSHSFDLTNETGATLIGQPGIGMSVALVPGTPNEVAATFTGIADNRRVTVWLNGIVGADMVSQNVRASIGFLRGDSNNSRRVDATDIARVKARSGQTSAQGGAEHDLNTSGVISSADIAAVKATASRDLVPGNTAPLVNAGGNRTLTLPASATLNGTVSDDGFPNPPAPLTLLWSQVAGPAITTFGNAAAAQTAANFPAAGIYTLRLTASDGQLSASADAVITVETAQPSLSNLQTNITAGFPQSVTVTAKDSQFNTITGYTGTVHFTSNDPQAVLPADYTFTPADAGVRVFNGLQLRTAGNRTVTVTDMATSATTSQSTFVAAATPNTMLFIQQPASGTVRTLLAPVKVALQDAFGNPTASLFAVTMSLANNPGNAVLSGTTVRNTAAGVATFDNLSLDNEGTGITLKATVFGLPTAFSSPFTIIDNITPAAVQDFSANAQTQLGIDLTWTATGDDGFLGTATSYMIKSHTAPLTAQNFATTGSVVAGTPTPSPAGFPESLSVNGLDANTPYHFALRVSDGGGNTTFAFASATTLPCDTGYTGAQCNQCVAGYVNSSGMCVPICAASNPCTSPPPAFCTSGTALSTYDNPGMCSATGSAPFFSCGYSPQTTDCSAIGRVCSTVSGVSACRVP
jgi:hypothetical protein